MGKYERAAATSLDVAETFGKEHRKVMRDIRELGCSTPGLRASGPDHGPAPAVLTHGGYTPCVRGPGNV